MPVLPAIPAWIAGIQRPRMARPLRPCNLDPGTPCRGDDVALLSLRLVAAFFGRIVSAVSLASDPVRRRAARHQPTRPHFSIRRVAIIIRNANDTTDIK